MTIDEYLVMPPNDQHTLLVYGKIVALPPCGAKHNRALSYLGLMLDRWTRHYKKGTLRLNGDMVLDTAKALVHSPDLLYASTANRRRFKDGRLFGPADLCVDIIERALPDYVACRKFADYQRYGVSWYWCWYLDRSPAIFVECQLMNGRYEFRREIEADQWFEPGLFPGLVFRLPQLLEGDLKAAVKGKAKKLM